MNIAFVTEHFHPAAGGVNTHVLELTSRLALRGHSVTVHTGACPGAPARQDSVRGVRVRRYVRLPGVKPFGGFLPRLDPDTHLIHLHDWFLLCHDWALLAGPRAPVVLTPHGALSRPAPIQRHPHLRALHTRLLRRNLPRLSAAVALTGWELGSLTAFFPSPAPRLEIIPNGVVLPPDADGPAPERRPLLFSVGRLAKARYEPLVRLLPKFPELSFWFAGPAPEGGQKPLLALARALGVENRVRYLGFVPDGEKYRLMRQALCVPLLTAFEAQGIVLLEAMACATPVLAFDVGGVSSTVDHGRDGFILNPADPAAPEKSVALLLGSPALRDRMGAAGREKVLSHHLWDDIAARTETLYRSVAG